MAYFSIPRSGLVGEFLLDGSANDSNDGTKNNGTASNVTYVTSDVGYQKQCGSFNGSTSRINCGTSTVHGNSFTIVAFFKRGTPSGEDMIFTKWPGTNDRYAVGYVGGLTDLKMQIGTDGAWRTISASTDTNWHMVTMAYNGTRAYGYLDNNSATVDIATTYSENNSTAFFIGDFAGGTGLFNGNISSVRVYNRVLTESERLALWHEFNRKLGGGSDFGAYIPTPTAHWDFMGDATDVVNSVAPAANSGTFSGTDSFGITKGVTYNGSSTKTDVASITGLTTFTWVHRFKTSQGTIGALFDATGPSNPTIYSYMGLVTANKYRFQYDYTGSNGYAVVESTTSLNDGNWHTVIITGDGTTNGTKLYVDGTLEATDASGKLATLNGATYNNAGFGYRRFSSSNWWAGSISDTMVFPGAFTSGQVAYLTNALKFRYPYAFRRSIPSSLSNGLLFRGGAFNGSTMYDESGNGYNFTGTATKVRAGQLDAGSFSSQLLTLTRAAGNEPTSAGSIAVWLKTSYSGSTNSACLGKNNVINVDRYGPLIWNYGTDGRVCFEVDSSSSYTQLFSNRAINDGKWHRVVGTWNGTTMYLYIDGTLSASTSQTVACQYDTNDWKLGGDSSNGTRYFPGSLAYPTLWNRALNSYEVMMDRYSTYIQ